MNSHPKSTIKLAIASGCILLVMVVGGIVVRWYAMPPPKTAIIIPAKNPAAAQLPAAAPVTIVQTPIDAASPPGNDPGFVMYWQAAAACKIDSPSSTATDFPNTGYPPSNPQWVAMAQAAWNADAQARQLARSARSVTAIKWPYESINLYLNPLRNLTNMLGDAALYADFKGDHAEAVEIVRDILHLADLLEEKPIRKNFHWLVACGLRAVAASRLEEIGSGDIFTNDPADTKGLQAKTARELIAQLLDQRPAREAMAEAVNAETGSPNFLMTEQNKRTREIANRVNMELSLAAMSMACHLYKLDNHRWPDSLSDLIPGDLPRAEIDPWGDGTQTFGYVLIANGLPDGSSRPLLYSRCNSEDGLFYIASRPMYEFYVLGPGDVGSHGKTRCGQFRDVTRWQPAGNDPRTIMLPLP